MSRSDHPVLQATTEQAQNLQSQQLLHLKDGQSAIAEASVAELALGKEQLQNQSSQEACTQSEPKPTPKDHVRHGLHSHPVRTPTEDIRDRYRKMVMDVCEPIRRQGLNDIYSSLKFDEAEGVWCCRVYVPNMNFDPMPVKADWLPVKYVQEGIVGADQHGPCC